jgi:polysaccharide export outer membrane protein
MPLGNLSRLVLVTLTLSGTAVMMQAQKTGQSVAAHKSALPAAEAAASSGKIPIDKPQPDPRQYRIGPGDVLTIDVWHEPEASVAIAPVRADGNISLPMVGQFQAASLTPSELEAALTAKYAEYIRGPQVAVLVKEINSQKIYVLGEVKREGAIRLDAPLNILQALAQAGGVTDYAKRKKIYVLRTESGKQVRLSFDYDAVVHGEKIEQNIPLLSGDTVIVPR